jgi:RNA polymerase sigma-70 factor (ECF subfamily)
MPGPSSSSAAHEPPGRGRACDDLTLVRSVLAGDAGARTEFSTRMDFVGRVLVVQNRRHGQPFADDELADLAQETLLVVWRKLAEFEGRSSLETWIYRFTCLEFLVGLRKRSRRPQPLGDFAEVVPPAVPAQVLDPVVGEVAESDEPAPLQRFLGHLAEREAEVVRLRHLETLSFREIAGELGITPSSAKTHYYRGLEKLRALLQSRTTAEKPR